jgi:hypothetical protein
MLLSKVICPEKPDSLMPAHIGVATPQNVTRWRMT